ncbi:AtzH-like domain-containing protein [Glaciihabitans sp. UYNi722]|uniref:AtzH-like domain-containing protein n=1 Tax=Glaciihabitans sp. UYNi722 TaxID=3156344 RepID=UPI00339A2E92
MIFDIPVLSNTPVPSGLLDAFWDYDAALMQNDVDKLDAAFLASASTLRGDGTMVIVGFDATSDFRASRTAVPTRLVRRIHVRVEEDDLALIIAEVASTTGTPGQQTQLWRRVDGGWKVSAAHVTAPAAPIDRTVWRIVGFPLLAPTDSGTLDGQTVAVKDMFSVRGLSIGAGIPEFATEGEPRETSAPVVQILLAAGASITGVAQTDQFAYGLAGTNSRYGTPTNPRDPRRIPGGSTSGASVAVSRGEVSIGLGTDTAGSIRVPASYQGLWGIRTTTGLVNTSGVLPLAPTFDAIGWLTRDGAMLERVTSAMLADRDTTEYAVQPELVIVHSLTALAADAVRFATDALAERLGAAAIELDGDTELWFAAFRTLQAFEAWQCCGTWITSHPGVLGAEVASRFADASRVTPAAANTARHDVEEARAVIRAALIGRILMIPTTADVPPLLRADASAIDADRARTLRLTFLASIAGVPAVAAPLPEADRLLAGVSFLGQERTDLSLVSFARRQLDN